uniref:Putative lipocalin-6 1 n=1 Tax=Amblyomma parvum TaxID=251391 RepID=A0A023G2M5_AMBPA
MVGFGVIIFCVLIITGGATERDSTALDTTNPRCAEANERESTAADTTNLRCADGFSRLQKGAKFRLALTTMRHLEVDTYRCVTAEIIEHIDETHTVMLTVEYQLVVQDEWHGFSQTFEFKQYNNGYNNMTSIGEGGAPSATYLFLNADPSCIILQAERFKRQDVDTHIPEEPDAREDETTETHENCMLWMTADESETSDSCRSKFATLCPQTIVRQAFSSTLCQTRKIGRAPQGETTAT